MRHVTGIERRTSRCDSGHGRTNPSVTSAVSLCGRDRGQRINRTDPDVRICDRVRDGLELCEPTSELTAVGRILRNQIELTLGRSRQVTRSGDVAQDRCVRDVAELADATRFDATARFAVAGFDRLRGGDLVDPGSVS